MPEGDTLYRVAGWLSEELAGSRLDALWIRGRGALAGGVVTEARALGKHVLLGLALRDADAEPPARSRADAIVHFHLGMYGKLRRYDAAFAGGRETAATSLWLARGASRWVVFRAMTAELIDRRGLADHPTLSRLGPDLLERRIDLADVVARARRAQRPTIADLLVDQSVAAGIGNHWKCEALFHERVHPLTPPAALDDAQLLALYRRARELMADAVARGGRDAHFPVPRSAPHGRRWVYGREGRPCPACSAPIRVRRMGDDARGVWFCPRCQGA